MDKANAGSVEPKEEKLDAEVKPEKMDAIKITVNFQGYGKTFFVLFVFVWVFLESIEFKVKRTTKFSKIFDAFCGRLNIKKKDVRFVFDGQRIEENQTPKMVSEHKVDDNCFNESSWKWSQMTSLRWFPNSKEATNFLTEVYKQTYYWFSWHNISITFCGQTRVTARELWYASCFLCFF